jgi:hypothetical protein
MVTDQGITTVGANRPDVDFVSVFHIGTLRVTDKPPLLGAIDANGLFAPAYT